MGHEEQTKKKFDPKFLSRKLISNAIHGPKKTLYYTATSDSESLLFPPMVLKNEAVALVSFKLQ